MVKTDVIQLLRTAGGRAEPHSDLCRADWVLYRGDEGVGRGAAEAQGETGK